jgi:hypothetical protein
MQDGILEIFVNYSYILKAYIQPYFCLNRLEVLRVVTVRSTVFWDTGLCSLVEVYKYFGGTHCLYFQGRRITYSACCLVDLLFNPEDGGSSKYW